MLKEYENSEDGSSRCRRAQKLRSGKVKQDRISLPLQSGCVNFHTQPQMLHSVAPQDFNHNAPTNRGEDIITTDFLRRERSVEEVLPQTFQLKTKGLQE